MPAFVVVCNEWFERQGHYRVTSARVIAVLQKIVGAEMILAKSDTRIRLYHAQNWIGSLWQYVHSLTPNYGSLLRRLLHVLAECYCQHAFDDDQNRIRGHLHGSLITAHLDLDTCEQPNCPWVSHFECDIDPWLNSGDCELLAEHEAEEADAAPASSSGSNVSEAHSRPATNPEVTKSSNGFSGTHRNIFGRVRKLICGPSTNGLVNEEMGPTTAADEQHDSGNSHQAAATRDLDPSAMDSSALDERPSGGYEGAGTTVEVQPIHDFYRDNSSIPLGSLPESAAQPTFGVSEICKSPQLDPCPRHPSEAALLSVSSLAALDNNPDDATAPCEGLDDSIELVELLGRHSMSTDNTQVVFSPIGADADSRDESQGFAYAGVDEYPDDGYLLGPGKSVWSR
jgi:hypothetical protein